MYRYSSDNSYQNKFCPDEFPGKMMWWKTFCPPGRSHKTEARILAQVDDAREGSVKTKTEQKNQDIYHWLYYFLLCVIISYILFHIQMLKLKCSAGLEVRVRIPLRLLQLIMISQVNEGNFDKLFTRSGQSVETATIYCFWYVQGMGRATLG